MFTDERGEIASDATASLLTIWTMANSGERIGYGYFVRRRLMEVDPAQLEAWAARPDLFVRELFGVVPDPWQEEVLRAFPKSARIAMKACKGPGKTAVEAWLAWNFLATRTDPKIAATSITSDNLRDNLWAEMAKWRQRAPWLAEHFQWTKTRIFCRARPETWWMSARTWNRTADRTPQGNTLAGLHADNILFILDESGGIPDAVMATAEAALASCVDGHIVQAGNPTHLEGPLWRACTSERRLWQVVEITADPDDAKRSTRVRAEWAKEQIEKYGRDNPWVLVNVFGKFPPGSLNTLIGPDECAEATKRVYRPEDYERAGKVLGVDVARFGDDASVIFPRQGLVAFAPLKFRNLDGTQGAGAVARKLADWPADAVFVDDTGGWGASWIDNLRLLGHAPIGVGFASRPNDPRYENKRSEMYFEAIDWIRRGGALPNCSELIAALSQTTYSFRGDRLLLEPKEQVKQRLGYSPDEADAFALTFAQPVSGRVVYADRTMRDLAMMQRSNGGGRRHRPGFAITDYEPMAG
jgi:phage terminase large subunit